MMWALENVKLLFIIKHLKLILKYECDFFIWICSDSNAKF